MAWSTVYTQAWSSRADNHTFMAYFLDTHLNGKLGWTVSAHPSADTYKRSIELALPSPWAGGSNVSNYWYVSWSATPIYWSWYEDATYTSVPGDLGTDTTNGIGNNSPISDDGDWRIWESSTDTEAILVTKGKRVYFYWPGSSEWFARPDLNWDGTSDNKGSVIGPYLAQSYPQLVSLNHPNSSGTSSLEYIMTNDVGVETVDFSGLGGGPYWIIPGVGWLYSGQSTILYPGAKTMIALPRTGADTAWFMSDTNSSVNRGLCVSPSAPWTVLFESNSSTYYLLGTSDLNRQCLALNMGSTEPDLS